MTQLQRVILSDTEPPREPLPDVKPALALTKPLDLVISSGADAASIDGLPDALATMRNLLPLAKALGFRGIESYVKWNFVERTPGDFDWSFYDALVDEIAKNDLKWFPLLIVGSAYALPDWFFKSPEMVGYRCLEHGIEIEIPTIFSDHQVKYVRRFLAEFGKHYGSRKALLGVRLGPSANYGEAQYPATGAWGYKGRRLHTHIGYWAGDPYASAAFRRWLQARYSSIADLNKAWDTEFRAFDVVDAVSSWNRPDAPDAPGLPKLVHGRNERVVREVGHLGARVDAGDRHLPIVGRLGRGRNRHGLHRAGQEHGHAQRRHPAYQRERQLPEQLWRDPDGCLRGPLLRREAGFRTRGFQQHARRGRRASSTA